MKAVKMTFTCYFNINCDKLHYKQIKCLFFLVGGEGDCIAVVSQLILDRKPLSP